MCPKLCPKLWVKSSPVKSRQGKDLFYGHGKHGTKRPIMVFDEGTPYWDYCTEQLHCLQRLATDPREP